MEKGSVIITQERGTPNAVLLRMGQWGQFFIVDKPYKNMLML